MCSLTEDVLVPEQPRLTSDAPKTCIKCKTAPPTVDIRGTKYCPACFTESVTMRFRTAIGKTDLKPNCAALVAFSGGISSAVMLHMARKYLNPDPRKRGRVGRFVVCHVDESTVFAREGKLDQVARIVESFGFELVVKKLEDHFEGMHSSFYGVWSIARNLIRLCV